MLLHNDADAFAELIAAAAEDVGLPQVHVEKDYWVTKSLKEVFQSPDAGKVIFKGGTSLSKAYNVIQRFSEDIDLAIVSKDLSNNQVRKLLRRAEQSATVGLVEIRDDHRRSTGSDFRRTVYEYPRCITEENFGQASDKLLIEVNCFTNPEPFTAIDIQTLIADTLKRRGNADLVEKYALEGFPVNVLAIERTLVEKLLGVIKYSYKADPVATLIEKIRHLYDICLILKQDRYRAFVQGDAFTAMCGTCIADEKAGFFAYDACLEIPFTEAPIFARFGEWRGALEGAYSGSFATMVYGELPAMDDIEETIGFIGKYVK